MRKDYSTRIWTKKDKKSRITKEDKNKEEMNNMYYVEEKMDKDEKVNFLGELRKRNKGNCKVGIYRKKAEEENQIWTIKQELNKDRLKEAKAVHEHSGHRLTENLLKIMKGSKAGEKKYIDEVIRRCQVCQKK